MRQATDEELAKEEEERLAREEEERLARIDETLALLPPLLADIERARERIDDLYRERARLFHDLADNGMSGAAIARAAGVTPMAVSFARKQYPRP